MSELRRSLSMRLNRRSYSTLEKKTAKEPQSKVTQLTASNMTKQANKQTKSTKKSTTSLGKTTSTSSSDATTSKVKQTGLMGVKNLKSSLATISQKIRKRSKNFRQMENSPSMINAAYTTPRRSARLQAIGTPSPISLKMYTPFHIETPDLDDSFTYISKRKALSEINESPLAKTPRRMTKQAITGHKQCAASLNRCSPPTASGY